MIVGLDVHRPDIVVRSVEHVVPGVVLDMFVHMPAVTGEAVAWVA